MSTVSDYRDLRVADITANPDQPRKHFDPEKLQELAASIAANGLLEPVVVRPHPGGTGWLLIAGERRWRACTVAGVETIPARIMDVDEVDAYVLSVAENVNRDDMTVMEEADAFAQLRAYGKPVEEIARVFGKRPDMVEARLLLLVLEPHIRGMVEAGTMGALLAWHIAKLQPGNQRVVAQRWARGDLDASESVALAEALRDAETETGFFDMVEPTEEERIEHGRQQRRVRGMVDQIERLSALLGDLAAEDPAELAAALGNDVAARLASVDRISRQAVAARQVLRKAKAATEARSLAVRDEVK